MIFVKVFFSWVSIFNVRYGRLVRGDIVVLNVFEYIIGYFKDRKKVFFG